MGAGFIMDGLDCGVDPILDAETAKAWASRRWGCEAVVEGHAHPSSIGDMVATITVRDSAGQTFRGYGYSGMAPLGRSAWWKAAVDLLTKERLADMEPAQGAR